MKKFSKILSVLLCLAMVFGLAAVVGAAEETATLTPSKLGLANEAALTTATIDKITFSASQGTHDSLAPRYWASDTTLRAYKGNTLTISPASGYKMISIVFSATKSDKSLTKDSTFENATAEGLGKTTVTLTSTDGTKAVTVKFGSGVYIKTIQVKYDVAGPVTHTHNYNETPDGAAAVVDGVNHSYSYTCTDSSCDNVKTETEAHTFGADGKCTACGFKYTGISQILTAKKGSWTAIGVVTYVSGKNVYIQDSTGGICLYCSAAADVSVGDVVTGTGSYKLFNGLPELEKVASVTKVTDSNLTLTPKTTTIGALTNDDICTYVKIEGATVSEITENKGKTYVTIKQGEDEITLFNPVTTDALAVGDVLTITAAVGCYNGLQLVNTNSSEIVVTNANPGGGEDNPPKTSFTGTLLSSLKDGDEVVIYSDYLKGLMTYKDSVYNDKHQLESTSATVADGKVSYKDGAIVLTVHVKDNVYSFTTPSGLYLYVDGTHTMFVSEAGENTQFVLEQAEGGFYVKCANATYNDKPQYLEAYKGVFTTYGMNANNASQYVFQFYAADPETPRTGDTTLSILVALMAVSALGITVVASKKKEF